MFFKLKFSKFIQNFRTLNVFGKFLLIVNRIFPDFRKNCFRKANGVAYYSKLLCRNHFCSNEDKNRKDT